MPPTAPTHAYDEPQTPAPPLGVVQQVFRHAAMAADSGALALVGEDERGRCRRVSWAELRQQVASLALALKGLGVLPGQRVAASLPNGPEAVVAWLASASLGALWLRCPLAQAPDAALERLKAFEPHLLIAADGLYHGGVPEDRSQVLADWRDALPTVRQSIVLRTPYAIERLSGTLNFDTLTARDNATTAAFEPLDLPLDHPLWVLPEDHSAMVTQSHGEFLQAVQACWDQHPDLRPGPAVGPGSERWHLDCSGDEAAWNLQLGALLVGAALVLFDGHPQATLADDPSKLWRLAARHQVSVWGVRSAQLQATAQAGFSGAALRAAGHSLAALRALLALGEPADPALQAWAVAQCTALGASGLRGVFKLPGGGQNPK